MQLNGMSNGLFQWFYAIPVVFPTEPSGISGLGKWALCLLPQLVEHGQREEDAQTSTLRTWPPTVRFANKSW